MVCYNVLYFNAVQVPTVTTNSPTTISLSWTSAGSEVDSYEVTWERDTSGECPDVDEGNATVSGSSTSYTITQLEEDSNYTITVTANNAVGSAISDSIIGMTQEAGKELNGSNMCIEHYYSTGKKKRDRKRKL